MLALQRAAGNRAVASVVQRGAVGPAVGGAAIGGAAVGPAVGGAAAPVADAAMAPPTGTEAAGSGRATRVQRGYLDDLAASARRSAMEAVSNYAKRIPGYDLLCMVLGKDVISDAPVPRSAAGLIDGVLGLIPGADRVRANLQESGATQKAGEWLEAEVPKLGLNWETIKALFRTAWDALDITDIADPAGAFRRIQGIFGPPLSRLRDFALAAGKKALEFVFEGALSLAGSAGGAVMGIIKRAGGVFDQIVANPMGFLGNLVNAVRGGLGNFVTNIGTHLRNGLVAWLTGSLGGVIRIPERFDLRGILGMALDFFGLTWARVKGKLGALIGADTLDMLEKGIDKLTRGAGFIGDLFKRGLSAITDRISEFAGGLVSQVMDGIRDWVARSVVGAAVTKLISMFNPAGAVIQAIIAIYNTVQFFIERGQQIAALASAIFDSIAEIAAGNIGRAVEWVEGALARAVPVALGFLSRLIGIGDIAEPVRGIISRVRGVVDQALDRAMAWVARAGAPIFAMVRRIAGRVRAGMDSARAWVRGQATSLREGARGLVNRGRDRLAGRGAGGEVTHRVRLGDTSRTLAADLGTGTVVLRTAAHDAATDADTRTQVTAEEQEIRHLTRTGPASRSPVANHLRQIGNILIRGHQANAAAGSGTPAPAPGGPLTPAQQQVQQALANPVRRHSENSGRVPRTGLPTEMHLESEHIVPVSWVSVVLRLLGQSAINRRAGGLEDTADDQSMHTVLIYKQAADVKTREEGPARAELNAVVNQALPPRLRERSRSGAARQLRSTTTRAQRDQLRADFLSGVSLLKSGLLDRFHERLSESVSRTERVVANDHTAARAAVRGHPSALPVVGQIRAAADRQFVDIARILTRRVESLFPAEAALAEAGAEADVRQEIDRGGPARIGGVETGSMTQSPGGIWMPGGADV